MLGAAAVSLAFLLTRFTRVAVEGSSMAPTLLAGDHLLVRRTRRARPSATWSWCAIPGRPGGC